VVRKTEYGEPGAAEHVTNGLINRRDKILRTWRTGLNPLADPRIHRGGRLSFEDAAVAAGVAAAPGEYTLTWSRCDEASGAPGASQHARRSEAPPR
jgi:hypothetical protein